MIVWTVDEGRRGRRINIVPWDVSGWLGALCVNVSVMPLTNTGPVERGPIRSSQAQHYNVLLLPGDVNELENSLSQSENRSWQAGPMRGESQPDRRDSPSFNSLACLMVDWAGRLIFIPTQHQHHHITTVATLSPTTPAFSGQSRARQAGLWSA